jgi:eukaryotic-like serine/threonine-protein kinase
MGTADTLAVPGYQVVQFLGSGAGSTIWQVRDRQDGKSYALKRVVKHAGADYRHIEQASNEYEIGHQLDHPNIRHIYQMRRIKRWLSLHEVHIVMELCHGKTVQVDRPHDLVEVLRIFLTVADAIDYMNDRGFIHADLKPNNIMVAPDGGIKIIDLGQSCHIGTVKQRIQGTPDFISPEQVHRRPIDARTDVFNYGASLYWALTGRPIPTVLPKEESVTFKADLVITPIAELNPDVPDALAKLVLDCVEQSPPKRPQSMKEVASRVRLIARTLERGPVAEVPDGDQETDV